MLARLRGSLFIHQILTVTPITLTDPNMTRFMMSIRDAVDLVAYAFAHGNPGNVFVQIAPPATFDALVAALERVFKADNEIRIIGTKHGEKLYETLLAREEMAKAEDMGNYYRISSDDRNLNYTRYYSEGQASISVLEDLYTS